MHFLYLLAGAAALANAFPNTPFKTSKRNILDSTGANFTYAGVNWPGAADVMIPEGLQYLPIASIVSKIKSLKMNVVRLTFAIEMIDDIKDNGGDVTIQKALTKALGASKGQTVFQQIIKNNPQFNTSTTRIQAFDAVAAELAKQQIYVHLDNHISKGEWCCGGGDGNAWFGDTYFNVDKWKRGLQFMASHGKSWPNLVSIGLRNELRKPSKVGSSLPYNWETWYNQVIPAADLVNAANPDILIFLSGLNFDTTLDPIPTGADLGGGKKFKLSNFKYANKLALELHNYQTKVASCDTLKGRLSGAGFKALEASAVNQMPVLLTEFGFAQADGTYKSVYATCLRKIIPEWDAGWTVWVIVGSYYIRSGVQDADESWGLLKHDWSDWRSADAIAGLKTMINASLS